MKSTKDTLKPAPERPAIPAAQQSRVAAPSQAASIGDFTQVVTHRIGGLLSGIEGFTDLLVPVLESEKHRDHAFRILESVSRIESILTDLKHYEDSLDLKQHRIGASILARDTMHLISDRDMERLMPDIRVDRSIQVHADERLVRQALLSILQNAFEASRMGGTPVSFSVDLVEQESTVRYRIYNTGGITDEGTRQRMFDPFFTTKAHNLGLGLTMARRIFRLHDGDVRLTSNELAVGTEFTCTLPVLRS